MKKLESGETMAGAVRKLQNDGTIAQLEMPGAMGVSMIVVKDLPWATGGVGARLVGCGMEGPAVVAEGATGVRLEVEGRLPCGLPLVLSSVTGRGIHSAVRSEEGEEGEEGAAFLLLAGDRDRTL